MTIAPSWDLSDIFPSLESRELARAEEGLFASIERLRVRFDELGVGGGTDDLAMDESSVAAFEEVTGAFNDALEQARVVGVYLRLLVAADASFEAAQRRNSALEARMAELTKLTTRYRSWVRRLGPEALVAATPMAAEHAFPLQRAAVTAAHQMSEPEEALLADLQPTAASAWNRLHGDVTSSLRAEVLLADGRTEVFPMTVVRGLATDHDAVVRRAAYEAELSTWPTVEVPLAAAMNAIKGQALVVNDRRGWPDALDAALHVNNIDRPTLDAMQAAVQESFPTFRRYLRAKAALLGSAGDDGGLPWWDLFAPVGGAGDSARTWEEAAADVERAFSSYAPALAGLARTAMTQRWIDAEPRAGKRGGAFCSSVGEGRSRILMTFNGSLDGVQTLAHELGHAYHNVQLASRTPLQAELPMTLAETASIFCETMITASALASTDDPSHRLLLLDAELQNACQVVVDIHSRFLFEQEVNRRRRQGTLSPRELCTLMLEAQDATYGEGLAAAHRHPYMWAVKPHYYSVSYYNFPYTFGLLFGVGLYRRYLAEPDAFRSGFDDLLSATGLAPAAELTAAFGIDVRQVDFWRSSIDVLRARVDEFCLLAGGRTIGS